MVEERFRLRSSSYDPTSRMRLEVGAFSGVRFEVGGPRAEIGDRRSEVGGQGSEVGGKGAESSKFIEDWKIRSLEAGPAGQEG